MRKNKKNSVFSFAGEVLVIIPDQRKNLMITIGLTAVGKVALASAPKVAGRLTDLLTSIKADSGIDWQAVGWLAVMAALLYLVGNLLDGCVQKKMVWISQTLARRLRDQVAGKLNRLPIGYLDSHPAGDIQSIVSTDIHTVGEALESSIPTLFGEAVLLVSIFAMMLSTNWRLTLIYAITLPAVVAVMLLIGWGTKRSFAEQMDVQGELNAFVLDSCVNHLAITSFGCGDEKLEAFIRLNRKNTRSFVKSRFISGFTIPVGALAGNVSFILLCLLGGSMIIRGTLTLGSLQAFLFYGNMLSSPALSVAGSIAALMQAQAAMERVRKLLEQEEIPADRPEEELDPDNLRGEITFEHVSFGYTPQRTLMHDVSFHVEKGMTVAIVGPSGAGKTTLINLLMRFYEIQGGRILLDGKDILKLSTTGVRSAFAMVLQDAWIFDGTVAENISYGRPDATKEEIVRAARIANCDSFIGKLPDGYDTWISAENGVLSAGEMQLIAIARCVLAKAKVLILDEATSQVDSRTEYMILQAMSRLREGQTCFMIAHRLYTIHHADKILFMMNGDIREAGTHEELMAMNGDYAKMYHHAD